MKRILSLVLVVAMCFSMAMISNAQDIVYFTVYEYDAILQKRQEKVENLSQSNITHKVAEATIEREAEKTLLGLSNIAESDLISDYGYTAEQAAILKSYDGGNLEDYPELRKAMGRMTGFITCVDASTQSITARMYWNWSTPPAYMVYEDAVSVAFTASSPMSDTMNVRLDTANSEGTITYYTIGGGRAYSESVDIDVIDRYHSTETRFQRMGRSLGEYAKTGNLIIEVDSAGDGPIGEVSFGFIYGLKDNSSLDVSFSYPWGVSINVEEGGTEMIYKDIVITADGRLL